MQTYHSVAGLQYYHTLQIILLLAELGSVVTAEAGSLKMGSRIMALTPRVAQEIEHHAVQICALAISNDSNAARVNAFGPIAFCMCEMAANDNGDLFHFYC